MHVAVAVAEQAIREGSANVEWPIEECRERVKARMWIPEYNSLEYNADGEV